MNYLSDFCWMLLRSSQDQSTFFISRCNYLLLIFLFSSHSSYFIVAGIRYCFLVVFGVYIYYCGIFLIYLFFESKIYKTYRTVFNNFHLLCGQYIIVDPSFEIMSAMSVLLAIDILIIDKILQYNRYIHSLLISQNL
jgi:hypothetical protein